jgi:hypothetical protein
VSLALVVASPRKFYANLGHGAGQDDDSLFALIWNATDETVIAYGFA